MSEQPRYTHKLVLDGKVQAKVFGEGMAQSIADTMPYNFEVVKIE